MIIGTMFTLFVVPSIYMLVARTRVPVSTDDADTETVLREPAEATV